MDRPAWPDALGAWWLTRAQRTLGTRDRRHLLASIVPEVARLSDLFTTERTAGFGGYAHDPRALLAYGLYFFPQAYVRAQLILAECRARNGRPAATGRPLRVLDLGAGTGAAGLACAAALAGGPRAAPLELTALDASAESLALCRELFAAGRNDLWPHARLETTVGQLEDARAAASRRYDLVLASFALNEAVEGRTEDEGYAWLARQVDRLDGNGVLLVSEPGTLEASKRLHRMRDRLLAERRAAVLAPCRHTGTCPMLPMPDAWCHEVRRWRVPETVFHLAQRLNRDVAFLRFSFLALTRPEDAPPPCDTREADRARLVSALRTLKGRMDAFGCAADGAVHPYELLTRGTTGADRKALRSIERGDLVRWGALRLLGDNRTLRAESLAERELGFEG